MLPKILYLYFIFISFKLKKIYCDCNFNNLKFDPTLLQTENGRIQGSCNKVDLVDPDKPGRSEYVLSWLSVPYAEPPINENRLKKPQPLRSWKHIRNGTILPNSCMQPTNVFSGGVITKMSEDCLYLNIYAPASLYKDKSNSEKLPIYIFIHGGRFELGSSSQYDSKILASLSNMIVVTINYRLGPFGFLYMADSDVSGNQGFLDQHMAIKWVYENADHFKGDKNRITIGGQSAGSFSVSYHLIYPPSWPYFRNAIMESGTNLYSTMTFLPLDEATRRAKDIFDIIGCDKRLSPKQIQQCVQKKDASTILKASYDYYYYTLLDNDKLTLELTPLVRLVQDGYEFKYSIRESFESGNFKKANILIGFNRDEGGHMVGHSGFFGPKPKNDIFLSKDSLQEYMRKYFKYFPTYPNRPSKNFLDGVIREYTKNVPRSSNTNYLDRLNQVIGEQLFICPSIDLSRIYSRHNRVFTYSFNHLRTKPDLPKIFGVVHADELAFVFAEPLDSLKYVDFTDDERRFSKQIIRYWSNFVRNNDPNINDLQDKEYNPIWPPFERLLHFKWFGKRNEFNSFYLILNANNIHVTNDLSIRHCNFWRNFNTFPNKYL